MGARYLTWIGGVEATVEIIERVGDTVTAIVSGPDGDDPRTLTLSVAGRRGLGWTVVSEGNGVTHAIVTSRDRQHMQVSSGLVQLDVRAISERDAWLGGADDDSGEGSVTVAMPGRVVKILANEGDEVGQGQPVLIIEAMKMENEVKAKRGGVVTAVHVEEGDSVEADRVLMEIGEA